MNTYIVFTAVVVCILGWMEVEALKCYTCGSTDSNSNCAKGESLTSTECGALDRCAFTTTTVGSAKSYSRSCTSKLICDGFKKTDNFQYSCCSKDECNGAGSIVASLGLSLVVAAFTVFYNKL